MEATPSYSEELNKEGRATATLPQKRTKRDTFAACVGTFTEYYDIGIYALVAPTIATHFFPPGDQAAAVLSTFAIFALGFVVRPFGSILFGAIGDRLGRTRALTTALLLMAASTFAVGILPTWSSIGVVAPLLLLLCRVVQSISVGGEFAGASSYLLETSEPAKRGRTIGILNFAVAIPPLVVAALLYLISSVLDNAAYEAWGWRIPFLLAAPLGLIGLYLRLRLKESDEFIAMKEEGEQVKNPVATALKTQWRRMLQLAAATAVTATASFILNSYMVTYLTGTLGYSRDDALLMSCAASLCFGIFILVGGSLADRYGRRPVLLIGNGVLIVALIPCFLLVTAGHVALAMLGMILFAACLGPVSTAAFIIAGELFPTSVRYTCNAVSYNFSYAAFGGTAPFIAAWMVSATGVTIAPAIYATAITLIATVALFFTLKETRGNALRDGAEAASPQPN
ncbi:MFS transporter [Streptomyces sp. NPDC001508]|uniref:MFS transporter n=1 Tax=Streptomyces sp. NPDC001508 TaxID=3154656 RepID=UPI00331AD875